MRKPLICSIALVSGCCLASEALAEDGWTFLAAPYFWMAGLEGDIGGDGHVAEVDASFSDIMENFDIGMMGQLEAHNGPLGFVLSPFYLSISASGDGPLGFVDADVESETTIVEAYATLNLTSSFEILAGGRYTQLDNEVQLKLPNGNEVSRTESTNWLDPMIGARYRRVFNDRWSLVLRGDIGGFGVESDSVWSANAMVGYTLGESSTLFAGYRALDYDYDDELVWDVRMEGPIVGVAFAF